MKVSKLLELLADLDETKIELFLVGLNTGFRNEWDCDLSYGVTYLGNVEMKIAAKEASKIVGIWEN